MRKTDFRPAEPHHVWCPSCHKYHLIEECCPVDPESGLSLYTPQNQGRERSIRAPAPGSPVRAAEPPLLAHTTLNPQETVLTDPLDDDLSVQFFAKNTQKASKQTDAFFEDVFEDSPAPLIDLEKLDTSKSAPKVLGIKQTRLLSGTLEMLLFTNQQITPDGPGYKEKPYFTPRSKPPNPLEHSPTVYHALKVEYDNLAAQGYFDRPKTRDDMKPEARESSARRSKRTLKHAIHNMGHQFYGKLDCRKLWYGIRDREEWDALLARFNKLCQRLIPQIKHRVMVTELCADGYFHTHFLLTLNDTRAYHSVQVRFRRLWWHTISGNPIKTQYQKHETPGSAFILHRKKYHTASKTVSYFAKYLAKDLDSDNRLNAKRYWITHGIPKAEETVVYLDMSNTTLSEVQKFLEEYVKTQTNAATYAKSLDIGGCPGVFITSSDGSPPKS